MARRFAKVSEEEFKTLFFYPSDLVNTKTTIPLRVGEERWIYTSTLRVSVYIHHYIIYIYISESRRWTASFTILFFFYVDAVVQAHSIIPCDGR